MSKTTQTSQFQQALEAVEVLSLQYQVMLLDILHNHLRQQRRNELLKILRQNIAAAKSGRWNLLKLSFAGAPENFSQKYHPTLVIECGRQKQEVEQRDRRFGS